MIRILLLVLVLGASGDHFLFDGHFMDAAQQVVGQILVRAR
jgi:hypothetical protein